MRTGEVQEPGHGLDQQAWLSERTVDQNLLSIPVFMLARKEHAL